MLLAFSPFTDHDVLRKTALFFNDAFPHSTVQCLGWVDGDILATQLPAVVPKFMANAMGARACGFFVTTEDGSSTESRICSGGELGGRPLLNYDLERIPASASEHHAIIKAFTARLMRCGLLSVSNPWGSPAPHTHWVAW